MMTPIRSALAALVLAALPTLAQAQDNGGSVNVYQYAVDHPVADVATPMSPLLGASVPQGIELATVGAEPIYGYFYHEGRPVIVDMRTRAIVRIDN